MHRLIRLARHLPVTQVPLTDIRELDEPYWFSHEGDAPTPRAIALHVQLMDACDLRWPIILSADGGVMDGMHRVAQALRLGHTHIAAQRFAEDRQLMHTVDQTLYRRKIRSVRVMFMEDNQLSSVRGDLRAQLERPIRAAKIERETPESELVVLQRRLPELGRFFSGTGNGGLGSEGRKRRLVGHRTSCVAGGVCEAAWPSALSWALHCRPRSLNPFN